MFDRDSRFFSLSKTIVQDFLQSVVLVDDRAHFDLPAHRHDQTGGSEPHDRLTTPTGRPAPRDAHEPGGAPIQDDIPDRDPDDAAHLLNAKRVIDSFAEKRMLCSVICPSQDDRPDLSDRLHNLARSADIIIIDWSLHGDSGAQTLEMLERLLDWTISDSEQLRLVVIYSGDQNFPNIPDDIEERLQPFNPLKEEDEFTITCGPVRITVLAKPGIPILKDQKNQCRIVKFENIADRVIEEFTHMTVGLIPNAILKSLTQIRQNTYKILQKFTAELDAPFLTHRVLLPTPEDAEEHLTTLITAEFLAILEEGNIGNTVNAEAIRTWVESAGKDFFLQFGKETRHLSEAEICTLLEKGIEKWNVEGVSKSAKNRSYKYLSAMFHLRPSEFQALDEEFALITILRSYYEQRTRSLTLGTILKHHNSKELSYWLCIQPHCDCVRIESERDFPFLPLKALKQTDENFEILLKTENGFLKFSINRKPYDLKMIRFAPSSSETITMITANNHSGIHYFQSTDAQEYQWVGELRAELAQKFAHEYATSLSRIGVNESEWLRLQAPKR